METGKIARRGIISYVIYIFIFALILAGGYMLFVHPGDPQPLSRSLGGDASTRE